MFSLQAAAVFEKALYVISLVALYEEGHIALGQLAVGAPDLLLGCLFVIAAYGLRSEPFHSAGYEASRESQHEHRPAR